jgi:hypothetical protein
LSSAHGEPAEQPEDEIDNKIELAKFSYAEVLDATKHQDDKIGRLLTSVAFLTAATLALAALSSADYIAARFNADPFTLPLALIALTIFLLAVMLTVLLLLTSLAAPLRVPGLAEVSSTHRRSGRQWAADIAASQLYFYSISTISVDRWRRKWQAPTNELRRERLASLIDETHNLATRTRFKYDRTSEAVALLSFALLSFGLAAFFVAVAAMSPAQEKIELEPAHRVMVGLIVGAYCGLQLLARVRYAHQSVDDDPSSSAGSGGRKVVVGEALFVISLPAFSVVLPVYNREWPTIQVWAIVLALLSICSIVSFWLASGRHTRAEAVAEDGAHGDNVRAARVRRGRNRAVMALGTVAVTIAALWAAYSGWYAIQLLATMIVVLGIVIPSALGPTLYFMEQRRRQRAQRTSGSRRHSNGGISKEAIPREPEPEGERS